ncbi:MAG: TIGR01212 family radical SAM protein [Eubacteriaceae bacterium]|nr:TIGR01212 family radical SAM protein [Eubacteriaceae bacterium]
MAGNEQINSIGAWLKGRFGSKVIKLSIDGGFTCPNRDGTAGTGGCTFCSAEGSGELSSDIPGQIRLLSEKWPNVEKYMVYFQSHTSTYAPADRLRRQYEAALSAETGGGDIVGIAIATRPDCLGDDVLGLLSELNEKTFLWVELGLQTIHGDRINRCYDLSVYDKAVDELTARGIRVVTHLILGLPGESRSDMEESLRYVCSSPIFGLKLHMLNVVKGSPLSKTCPDYVSFDTPEEYIDLVCDLLEIIPPEITIHRLNGDVPRKLLISPGWSYKKRTILNGIAHEMKSRGSFQGCRTSGHFSGSSRPSL